ncbi:MAG: M56 family metallopeptidase [Prevotella sp.]
MIFIFKSAITLALLYSCFFAFLGRETFHRFNRIVLICIMVATLTIPLLRLKTETPGIINRQLDDIEQQFACTIISTQGAVHTAESLNWMDYTIIIYVMGAAVMACLTLINLVKSARYLRGGLRHTDAHGNTVILKTGDVMPFSMMRYIVMSVHDYENNRDCILTHEQEHIRLGHTYDLMLWEVVKTVQWFNPFIWLLGRDLRCIHEFEADKAVIKQGIDAKTYQTLLVEKATGKRLQPLANSLNHSSLKRRIIMMYRKESSRWMMLKALCALPVAALTVAAFAKPVIIDHAETAISTAQEKVTEMVKLTVKSRQTTGTYRKGETTSPPKQPASDTRHTAAEAPATAAEVTTATREENPAADKSKRPVYTDMPEYTGKATIAKGVRIRRAEKCTYVTLICTCNGDAGIYKIGGKENRTFIEDIETGDHYKARRIVDDGIVFGRDGFIVAGMKGKRWAVTLEFPPLPDNVQRVRFWHLADWADIEHRIIDIQEIEER